MKEIEKTVNCQPLLPTLAVRSREGLILVFFVKMQCCVPLCENTSENFSTCGRITFHGFPSEPGLHAAWLRALGIQDSQLLDSAVVCSQHFLHDDICESESGSRQLRTGAVPSTVLVCMTCLDTECKMSPISQYNLDKAYEELTGHPLWDGGNLKQTLCVQCAQQLRDFSRFREQSLRARSLMMELLEKHEVITIQHIKMILYANNILRNNLGSTTLGPDHCDKYVVGNSNEVIQAGSQTTVHGATVKTECSEDSQWKDENTRGIKEEDGCEEFDVDLIKNENAAFMCTVCCEQFPHERAYSAHVCTHLHDARPHAASPHTAGAKIKVEASPQKLLTVSPIIIENACIACEDAPLSERPESTQHSEHSERALVSNSGAADNRAPDTDYSTYTVFKSCVVELQDVLKYPQNAKVKVEPLSQKLRDVSSHDNAHTACEDARVADTHNKPAASVLSETEPATSGHSSHTRTFTCNVCKREFKRKDNLVRHMKSHSGEKPYSCKKCSYKFSIETALVSHMRTHTGEKLFSCNICSYESSHKGTLVTHMRKHTGEKPYSCKICSYKSRAKSALVNHMWTHTGQKPYSCNICSYKCSLKSNLVAHMRIHTGEKPYSCKICSYKCSVSSSLVKHIWTHTGQKPYSCNICSYKSTQKGNLVAHMRIHTGEKPYSCKICSYECSVSSSLVKHMWTHRGAH